MNAFKEWRCKNGKKWGISAGFCQHLAYHQIAEQTDSPAAGATCRSPCIPTLQRKLMTSAAFDAPQIAGGTTSLLQGLFARKPSA